MFCYWLLIQFYHNHTYFKAPAELQQHPGHCGSSLSLLPFMCLFLGNWALFVYLIIFGWVPERNRNQSKQYSCPEAGTHLPALDCLCRGQGPSSLCRVFGSDDPWRTTACSRFYTVSCPHLHGARVSFSKITGQQNVLLSHMLQAESETKKQKHPTSAQNSNSHEDEKNSAGWTFTLFLAGRWVGRGEKPTYCYGTQRMTQVHACAACAHRPSARSLGESTPCPTAPLPLRAQRLHAKSLERLYKLSPACTTKSGS